MSGKDRPTTQLNSMAHLHYQLWTTGTAAVEYPVTDEVSHENKTVLRPGDLVVFVDGKLMRQADQTAVRDYRIRGLHAHTPATSAAYPGDSNTVTFTVAPNGKSVCFLLAGG